MEHGRGLGRGDSRRRGLGTAAAVALAVGTLLSGAPGRSIAPAAAADPLAPTLLAPVVVTLDQATTTAPTGLHRIDPGTIVSIKVSVTPATDLSTGTLVETIPLDWEIGEAPGAGWDSFVRELAWPIADLSAGVTATRTFTVVAPALPTPAGALSLTGSFGLRFEQELGNAFGPGLAILVAPRIVPGNVRSGQVMAPGDEPTWLGSGTQIGEEPRFQPFRLRFELGNPDDVPVGLTPLLEILGADGRTWTSVPAGDPTAGQPFYAAREWTRVEGGTALGQTWSTSEPLPDEFGRTTGWHASGENPAPAVELAARAATFVEFTVRATVDASYGTAYQFRLTDGGAALPFAPEATVTMEPQPVFVPGPDWHGGSPVDTLGGSFPRYPLSPLGAIQGGEQLLGTFYAIQAPNGPFFGSLNPATNVHDGFALLQGDCAICHETHATSGRNLNITPTQYDTCTLCHQSAASGTPANVVDDYTTDTGGAPANDPSSSSWYRHDLAAPGHNLDGSDDGLAGTFNRHAQCADCHTPHRTSVSDGSVGTDTTGNTTWLASGRLAGSYGVAVVNGDAGMAPTYKLERTTRSTPEYEICFKCHSGYTTQTTANPAHPSWDHTDKGIELNPATTSYHPIEAPGKNGSTAMTNSLAGPSTYKQWDLSTGSVVRCSNCHGDSRLDITSATTPVMSASYPLHASNVRGILLANYRDRILKSASEVYAATDFALCSLCHAEAPFVDTTGTARSDTNFPYHGYHVSNLASLGSGGTDIDTAGDGQGNAICAECHFRIHGTALAVSSGDRANKGLVNFAPNVTAGSDGTTRAWTWIDETSGTCTLTCHGAPHTAAGYGTAQGLGSPPMAPTAILGLPAPTYGPVVLTAATVPATPVPAPTATPAAAPTPVPGAPTTPWEFFTWLMRQ